MSNISRKEAEQFLRSIDDRIEDLLGLDCYNKALNALTELLDKAWEQGFQDHEWRTGISGSRMANRDFRITNGEQGFQDHETGAKLMGIMSRDSK